MVHGVFNIFSPNVGVRGVLNGDNCVSGYLLWPLSKFKTPLTPNFGKIIIEDPVDHKVEVLGIILSHI